GERRLTRRAIVDVLAQALGEGEACCLLELGRRALVGDDIPSLRPLAAALDRELARSVGRYGIAPAARHRAQRRALRRAVHAALEYPRAKAFMRDAHAEARHVLAPVDRVTLAWRCALFTDRERVGQSLRQYWHGALPCR